MEQSSLKAVITDIHSTDSVERHVVTFLAQGVVNTLNEGMWLGDVLPALVP